MPKPSCERAPSSDVKTSDAELDLVRFLYKVKGYEVAQQELTTRIRRWGRCFPLPNGPRRSGLCARERCRRRKIARRPCQGPEFCPIAGLAAKIKLAEINIANKNIDAADAILADVLREDGRNTTALKLRAAIQHGAWPA